MHHRPNVCRQIFWQRVYPQIPSVVHASVGIGHGAGANTYLAQPKNVAWGGAKPKRCGTSNGQIFSCDLTTYPTPNPHSLLHPQCAPIIAGALLHPHRRHPPTSSPPSPLALPHPRRPLPSCIPTTAALLHSLAQSS